jgi:hypothetical protein
MPPRDEPQAIKITLEDLKSISAPGTLDAPDAKAATLATDSAKSYGNIATASDESPVSSDTRPSIFLQAWFYLGIAGLIGALTAWGICEPAFLDGQGHRWGNTWMLPSIVTLLCVSFGLAESIVERSGKKAAYRTALAFPLGIIFGFVVDYMANVVFNVGLGIAASLGVRSYHNPSAWVARGIGWVVFGVAGGLVYGIIGQSAKKAQYGILGGMLGAGIGGILFDPISFVTFGFHGAALSRMIGFSLFGFATGTAMGIVESALKDRWLYVSSGPLSGKQFIMYKQVTTIGSSQSCDVYLFKDPNILPEHAVIEGRGNHLQIRANGLVYVAGQPVQTRVLADGDFLQIGRYGFRYKEKQKS